MEYAWTTGADPAVSHRKPVGVGGYGEVHEVGIPVLVRTELLDGIQ